MRSYPGARRTARMTVPHSGPSGRRSRARGRLPRRRRPALRRTAARRPQELRFAHQPQRLPCSVRVHKYVHTLWTNASETALSWPVPVPVACSHKGPLAALDRGPATACSTLWWCERRPCTPFPQACEGDFVVVVGAHCRPVARSRTVAAGATSSAPGWRALRRGQPGPGPAATRAPPPSIKLATTASPGHRSK